MLSAGKAGNGYIGNWNRGTSLILQEYQIHSHRPAHLSDWSLSLEIILCKSKTRWKWRFKSRRMWCSVTGQVPHSVSEDSDAFHLKVRQSKKKALWSTENVWTTCLTNTTSPKAHLFTLHWENQILQEGARMAHGPKGEYPEYTQ